jgi:hypothetical protein
MRKLITLSILALIVTSLALVGGSECACAQAQLAFSELEIDIWPEYDQPGVLVIYHITLAPEVSLPADISLRIPTSAGEPSAVAVRDAGGGLFSVTHSRQVNGEWSTITMNTTMPELQLEYYDTTLSIQGSSRHYEYAWPGDYAVEALTVDVQQPVDARNMHIKPDMGSSAAREDGLNYFSTQAGALQVGQTFEVVVDYDKDTQVLSAENLQVLPSAPVSNITPATRNLLSVLPWILGGLGVVLIFGGVFWWYWQSGLGKMQTKAPHRRRKLVLTASEEDVIPEGHVYCHHCGKRAIDNDRFCRACGTRLRR